MARGPIALVILVILVLAYCCELAQGTATQETHQLFWGVIILSAIATAIAYAWESLTKKK